MVANILPSDTPLTQGVGSKGQSTYFSESSHVAYQIKVDEAGSNMVANIFHTDTPSTHGVGSKGQTVKNNYFSESSHVAYPIKADEACSNMVPNISTQTHPRPRGLGQKVKLYLFLKVVMLHIKLKRMEHGAP